ncbi:MAG: glycosyltransferase family 4 protein [Capsulimonadaceae bacterium]|nr:glycosyltransferase family 4 protein [Capsulimonadaceae bacterium]
MRMMMSQSTNTLASPLASSLNTRDAGARLLPAVLLLTDSDSYNGTERHIMDLASGLRALDAPVTIGCPADSPLASKAIQDGFITIGIEKRGAFDLTAVRQLQTLLRTHQIDIIHAHNGRTGVLAGMAAGLAGRGACITTQHFIEPARASRRGLSALVSRQIHAFAGRKLAHVIAVSEAARRGIIGRGEMPPHKVSVVPNGIVAPNVQTLTPPEQVRASLGVSPATPLVVCVARLEVEKDISSLIRAMVLLTASFPECQCVVAGEGSERKHLEALIASERMEANVRLLGYRSDALSLINASDVLVLPSLSEPFGLVLLEAMALAKPVVATTAGGPLEIVLQGLTGLLSPPSKPAALAESLLSVVADPERATKMGRAGQERYWEKFTAKAMAASVLDIYVRSFRPRPEAALEGSAV